MVIERPSSNLQCLECFYAMAFYVGIDGFASPTKALTSKFTNSTAFLLFRPLSLMHVALVGGKVMVGLEVVFGCENGAEVVMEVVFVAVEVGCDGHGDLGQRWSWKCAWERKKKKDKKRDIRNFGGTSSNN
ncbi:hypothetical protein D0Y65_041664 [Glycine soja]|uniref:Uncharacterized protein n=1 Tax=Glycine soja TaxID=3848 RepID=A0A445GWS5_GLYSO|nr:hypothetical protein D0Y65_041664 [Glycine soja]